MSSIRDAMLDLLHKLMLDVDDEDVVGYVVVSYERAPLIGTQVDTAVVIGPFDTELEAVEVGAQHHRDVHLGMDPDDPEGWETRVKPLIGFRPAPRALNDPTVDCCGRDAADCDCPPKES